MSMTVLMTAQDRDRAKVADAYKWNLADVYPEPGGMAGAEGKGYGAKSRACGAFRGKLGSSAATLADALELSSRLDKELSRLYVYASMLSDEDTRVSERAGHAAGDAADLRELRRPGLVHRAGGAARSGAPRSRSRLAPSRGSQPYAFYLRDIARRAAHTLSDSEEKILADASPMAGSANNIYTILANADFPYPTITLADGRTVKVDQAGYASCARRRIAPTGKPRCRRSSARLAASAGRSA